MFLKSLELNGFKSFAQKTILEFPIGITAVVGPNGAGKSNIIDAIRWLLGEREAKNLRSAKAEDLIFNGTPKRPRLGMAQAGLYFDNNSGFFPVDFKEILVVRRVGRDGVSQYFLNKAEVRLKDIIDFFSRSRLGTKGLSIINQGESDSFVRVSLEERRLMIEEILGLREFQIKKNEAERKLRATFFNLEKVRAMIEEVLPRLRLLKRQTNKWAKRMEIQKELDDLEKNYFSYKLKEIKVSHLKIEPVLISLEKQINKQKKELGVLESEIKKRESQPKEYEELKKIKNQKNELLAQRFQIQKELGRLEAKLEIWSTASVGDDKIFENKELIGLISEVKAVLERNLSQSDFEQFKKAVQEIIIKIENFLSPNNDRIKSKELTDLENLKNDLAVKFNALETKIEKLEGEETEITTNLEEFNKYFQKNFELIGAKREELRDLEEERNKILLEKERLKLKLQDLENQLAQIGKPLKEFDIKGDDIEAQQYKPEDLSDIERRMFRLRSELAAIGEIDQFLIKEAREVEEHYTFLTNQLKDLEKAAIDLKALIKELSEKIQSDFTSSLRQINGEFNKFFRMMFGGGSAKLRIKNLETRIRNDENNEKESSDNSGDNKNNEENGEGKIGVEIDLSLPKRRINTLEMLSGGERSLVSIAAIFSLISISPPPFLVLDEIDAALDESNSKRFAELIKEFSKKTQFIIVTHNRATMESANVLYGVTIGEDGTSRVLSLKLE